MAQPNDTFPEKISNLIQASWDSEATGLQVTDVAWSHDRFETLNNAENESQKAIISTYNPPNPRAVEVLSAQTNFIRETIVVDVILHSASLGGVDQCLATRETIATLISAVIHGVQQNTSASLAGADAVWLEGEYACVEEPQTQRETLKVVVGWFEVLPS